MVSVYAENVMAGGGSGGAVARGGGGSANSGGGGTCGGGSGGELFHCADAFVTIVSVDGVTGRPVQSLFELAPQSAVEVLRYEAALERRAARLRMRQDLAASEPSRRSLDLQTEYLLQA